MFQEHNDQIRSIKSTGQTSLFRSKVTLSSSSIQLQSTKGVVHLTYIQQRTAPESPHFEVQLVYPITIILGDWIQKQTAH